MAEPAITEAEELRRQGRRGLVPCHAPIDARIVSPALLSVTVDPQSFVPIAPRTARLGRLAPAHVERRQSAGPVQKVRSEERPGGKGVDSTFRSRWSLE